MTIKLSQLKKGDKARVSAYAVSMLPTYRQKLLAMGLTLGCELVVKRIAPLGDPVEIEVRGFTLCLRKKEAEILLLEKV